MQARQRQHVRGTRYGETLTQLGCQATLVAKRHCSHHSVCLIRRGKLAIALKQILAQRTALKLNTLHTRQIVEPHNLTPPLAVTQKGTPHNVVHLKPTLVVEVRPTPPVDGIALPRIIVNTLKLCFAHNAVAYRQRHRLFDIRLLRHIRIHPMPGKTSFSNNQFAPHRLLAFHRQRCHNGSEWLVGINKAIS